MSAEYLQLINDIYEEAEDDLNEWERDFLSDVSERLEEDLPISGPTQDKIREIWTDKVAGV
jgi:hypothetical protein